MAANDYSFDLQDSVARFMDVQMFMAILVICGIGIVMMTSTTVEIGYKALELLIDYEGNQTGPSLVSSDDHNFVGVS